MKKLILASGSPRRKELLETAGNDVNGNIRFSEIHYTEVGEHIYTIRQKEPAAARRIENMEYDPEAEISVRMSVTDNGEGDLLSDAVYERERFINSYAIRTVMK